MKTKTTLSITKGREKIFSIAEKIQKEEDYFTLTERGVPKVVMLSAQRFENFFQKNQNGMLARERISEYGRAPQIEAQNLIIRDESKIVYLAGGDQASVYQEEALIKSQLYVQIIEKYGYPIGAVEFGKYVKIGSKESRKFIEADLIINDERGYPEFIFEVSAFDTFETNKERAVSDLFETAEALSRYGKKPRQVIYFSRQNKKGKVKEKIVAIDCQKFQSFLEWEKKGFVFENKIPKFR